MGNCSNFTLFGEAGVAASGTGTVVTGNVGGSGAITGFPDSAQVATGYTVYDGAGLTPNVACTTDRDSAYSLLVAETCTNSSVTELADLTLVAGVYCVATSFTLSSGTLTLAGTASDVWVFISGTTTIASANTNVVLTGGAVASNVFWAVGSSATLTSTTDGVSTFVGTIIAHISVSIGTQIRLHGRALTQTASVTLAGTDILFLPSVNATEFQESSPTGWAALSPTYQALILLGAILVGVGLVVGTVLLVKRFSSTNGYTKGTDILPGQETETVTLT